MKYQGEVRVYEVFQPDSGPPQRALVYTPKLMVLEAASAEEAAQRMEAEIRSTGFVRVTHAVEVHAMTPAQCS